MNLTFNLPAEDFVFAIASAIVFILIFFVGFGIFLFITAKRMDSSSKTGKRLLYSFAAVSAIFGITAAIFSPSVSIRNERATTFKDLVVAEIEKTYDLELDRSSADTVEYSVAVAAYKFYDSTDLPVTVSVKEFGTEWQSDKFTVRTDEGLQTVYLANDTDGKTYLWMDKPTVKDKFTN